MSSGENNCLVSTVTAHQRFCHFGWIYYGYYGEQVFWYLMGLCYLFSVIVGTWPLSM